MAETNGDRVTLALVSAQVEGLKNLMLAQHESTQRQLDAVAGLPVSVANIATTQRTDGERIGALERVNERRRDWRSTWLPQIIVGVIASAAAIVGVIEVIHP